MVVAASASVAAHACVEVGTAALLGGLLALSFAVRRGFVGVGCTATPAVATGERA